MSDNSSDDSYTTESSVSSSDQACDTDNNLDLHGKILGNYNIIYEIGRGGYSIVWLAYNISNMRYYALKVQDPNDFNDGYDEVKFVSTLPTNECFNNIIEYFIHIVNKQKYLCSVWNLHATNLDTVIRKGKYKDGLHHDIANKIMRQITTALNILHNKFKVYHGDIKPDNIFLKGINSRDAKVIELYNKENYHQKYKQAKTEYWLKSGKKIKNIDNMKKSDRHYIRQQIHADIIKNINIKDILLENIELTIDNCNVSLGDFGTYCGEDNYYEEAFGTRYYQAPEIILRGKCSYGVDVWALGCTYFELLTGQILFDPNKDKEYSRDYYHLSLINDTCGNFPINFLKSTKLYKNFFNKYKLINYSEPKVSRMDRKLSEYSNLNQELCSKILHMLSIECRPKIDTLNF